MTYYWTPSPALATAVREALALMETLWPRSLGAQLEPAANTEFATTYSAALKHLPPEIVVPAAREWMATNKWSPKPAELAKLATAMHKRAEADADVERGAPRGTFAGCRVLWFDAAEQLFGYHWGGRNYAFQLTNGRGTVGISQRQWDDCRAGRFAWGYVEPRDYTEHIRALLNGP